MEKNTRQDILWKVYQDIKKNGFNGCRPDKAIRELGITKGALYHYFPDKLSLGYAIVEEIIEPRYLGYWNSLADFQGNALNYLIDRLDHICRYFDEKDVLSGSSLSNLIQEMAGQDEGFRQRLEKVVHNIQAIIIGALRKSRDQGLIPASVQVENLTYFFLAALEGSYNQAKVFNNKDIFIKSIRQLQELLKQIKHG
jgi:AcrR family transcriptional regulator